MRVGIVNDSALAVEALRRVLVRTPHVVAWVASDGVEGIALCKADVPDLVLMDLRMPNMGGVACTKRIMAESPCPILIVTATVDGSFSDVYDALGAGALDAVNTPVLGRDGAIGGDAVLLAKITMVARLTGRTAVLAVSPSTRIPVHAAVPPLVVLGASTGGPDALARILTQIPASLGAAVVIIQHVDRDFAPGLAAWLTDRTRFPCEIAVSGDGPRAGVALIAATNDHLVLTSARTFLYTPHPRDYHYRPSVDVFFHSVVEHWPGRGIAAVLTGMGRDGADGLRALRGARWTTIAQDEASSVVYGMPRAAAELGAATEVLALDSIGAHIASLVRSGSPRRA